MDAGRRVPRSCPASHGAGYINVAGADPKAAGQFSPKATHLIKRAAQVALGQVPHLDIFGTDYPPPDGAGVRDYIRVTDLAGAHLLVWMPYALARFHDL